MENSTPKGFVYAIHAKGTRRVKIGYSVEPEKRLNELQTGCPYSLILIGVRPGTVELERTIHRRLKPLRLEGEWFRMTVRQALAFLMDDDLTPRLLPPGRNSNPFAVFDLLPLAEALLANADNPDYVRGKAEELMVIAEAAFDVLAEIGARATEAQTA